MPRKIPEISFFLHCWKTAFYFIFHFSKKCSEKRFEGSQGLGAIQCLCWQRGGKMMRRRTDEPAETHNPNRLFADTRLSRIGPAKSHSAGKVAGSFAGHTLRRLLVTRTFQLYTVDNSALFGQQKLHHSALLQIGRGRKHPRRCAKDSFGTAIMAAICTHLQGRR